ncbi:MAG: ATP synthase subunit I [Nitrospinae bacterium CG11_big_fil_rev_8_21_14_0_20_45_15]|nr:MAG: ATP synthase subunit I [Nitrospinae bacterium CG11_big_fil_rev_8_21_14_0_20_45_15]
MSEDSDFRKGVGFAFRVGTELVVSVFVGTSMGYALDWFFGTKPWLMVAGLLLGGVAGGLMVYKVATHLQEEESEDRES